jgi:hypothetical protein
VGREGGTLQRCSKGKEPHAARQTAHGKRSCCLFPVAMRMQADGTLALPQPNSIAGSGPRALTNTLSLLLPACSLPLVYHSLALAEFRIVTLNTLI